MMRFLRKEIDVLVCTTIIESGLDIPSANTIIINEVDRFGLGQIYQLRGRVGRSREKAYAYLFLSNGAALTKDAEKRLKALMDFSHLGAGLHLAMHDLKIRGGGNILGFAQSGHIAAVGYELYMRLIEEAVSELKGEAWQETVNPEINVKVSAYLPSDYVIDTDVRLSLYRRLSLLREKHELEKIKEEIHDRFGPVPEPVRHLFDLMSLRLLMKDLGIARLDAGRDVLTLSFSHSSPVDRAALVRLVSDRPRQYQFLSDQKLRLHLGPLDPSSPLKRVQRAIETMADLSRGSPGDERPDTHRRRQAFG
jgi:transcription-repair coupling factor (superfamily II helicase)